VCRPFLCVWFVVCGLCHQNEGVGPCTCISLVTMQQETALLPPERMRSLQVHHAVLH
jgi:hypothetical protein